MANSADPDEMAHYNKSQKGLPFIWLYTTCKVICFDLRRLKVKISSSKSYKLTVTLPVEPFHFLYQDCVHTFRILHWELFNSHFYVEVRW